MGCGAVGGSAARWMKGALYWWARVFNCRQFSAEPGLLVTVCDRWDESGSYGKPGRERKESQLPSAPAAELPKLGLAVPHLPQERQATPRHDPAGHHWRRVGTAADGRSRRSRRSGGGFCLRRCRPRSRPCGASVRCGTGASRRTTSLSLPTWRSFAIPTWQPSRRGASGGQSMEATDGRTVKATPDAPGWMNHAKGSPPSAGQRRTLERRRSCPWRLRFT